MRNESREFLMNYLSNPSPSGFEVLLGSQKIWSDYIKPFVNSVELDPYGSCIARLGNVDSEYKVVIEAHADEIGYYVNYIDKKGYIRVIRNGGSDISISPSMRVNIYGKKGKTVGVFGHPAIHVHKHKPEVNLDTAFVDVGATTKQEVLDMGIEIGSPIVLADGYFELNSDKWICGRALDNKIGGFIIAEVARYIKENNIVLDYQLVIVNSVMEEVGLYGATMNSGYIKPDVALVVDVCHDISSPAYNEQKEGSTRSGDGGVLTIAPTVHNNVLNFWRDCLDENEIKYQLHASYNQTGTDTDAYSIKNIPSCLISVPLSYMHTSVEKVSSSDVESVIKSYIAILSKIKENQVFGYQL
jgi:putative aminopeptidase FrvX